MDLKIVKTYVEILKNKGSEIVEKLPNINVEDEKLRESIINFNNIFTNIQQYEMLIKEIEAEQAELSE